MSWRCVLDNLCLGETGVQFPAVPSFTISHLVLAMPASVAYLKGISMPDLLSVMHSKMICNQDN